MLGALQRVSVNQHINGRPFNYWHTPLLLPMNHYQQNIIISLPKSFHLIYPSQRQNLLPTLEIITHNFQNFGKKFQNLEFFSKISVTTKGQ